MKLEPESPSLTSTALRLLTNPRTPHETRVTLFLELERGMVKDATVTAAMWELVHASEKALLSCAAALVSASNPGGDLGDARRLLRRAAGLVAGTGPSAVVVLPLSDPSPAAPDGPKGECIAPDLDPLTGHVGKAALEALGGKRVVAVWMGTNFRHWTLEMEDGSYAAFFGTSEGLLAAGAAERPVQGTAWRFA